MPRRVAKPIHLVTETQWSSWVKRQPTRHVTWLQQCGAKGSAGESTALPGPGGEVEAVVLCVGDLDRPWGLAELRGSLPPGRYEVATPLKKQQATALALGWELAAYRFARYLPKESRRAPGRAELSRPNGADVHEVKALRGAMYLARDLINTPAQDMMPSHLAAQARALARQHGAKCTIIKGEKLLSAKYPAIHAVGRASADEPRLIDLRWGTKGKRLTLVGKGVCFDSGGLDLKTAAGMRLMKKDMGGGAIALGLASAIMATNLPLRLRVLVPAVENAVSSNAFHPGDVLATRKGITVEVGNTDAEGRLVLCDALWEAAAGKPDLIVDVATLTGAARVALGTDLPALFCNRDRIAQALLGAGDRVHDPLWRLPLHGAYRPKLKSRIADLSNISSGSYGGAITAALFLEEFVNDCPWVHIDTMAWNLESRPGRPAGGEGQALRALYNFTKNWC